MSVLELSHSGVVSSPSNKGGRCVPACSIPNTYTQYSCESCQAAHSQAHLSWMTTTVLLNAVCRDLCECRTLDPVDALQEFLPETGEVLDAPLPLILFWTAVRYRPSRCTQIFQIRGVCASRTRSEAARGGSLLLALLLEEGGACLTTGAPGAAGMEKSQGRGSGGAFRMGCSGWMLGFI